MVELKGSLGGIGLPAIIQLISELRHTGNLELTRNAIRGGLDFEDGRLVGAAFCEELGLGALASCSRELGAAEFRFIEGPPAGERTIDLGPAEVQRYLARLA